MNAADEEEKMLPMKAGAAAGAVVGVAEETPPILPAGPATGETSGGIISTREKAEMTPPGPPAAPCAPGSLPDVLGACPPPVTRSEKDEQEEQSSGGFADKVRAEDF